MTATTHQRLTDLESDVLRLGHRVDTVHSEITDRLDHLTGAIGELSQGQRALRSEMGELAGTVAGIASVQTEHGQLLAEHGALLRAIAAHLNITAD